jgi:hypothetical protein
MLHMNRAAQVKTWLWQVVPPGLECVQAPSSVQTLGRRGFTLVDKGGGCEAKVFVKCDALESHVRIERDRVYNNLTNSPEITRT